MKLTPVDRNYVKTTLHERNSFLSMAKSVYIAIFGRAKMLLLDQSLIVKRVC